MRNPLRNVWPFKPRNQSTGSLTDVEFWREMWRAFQTASGIHVTPLKAMGVSTVFACRKAVANTIGALPLKLYRRVPGRGKEEAPEHPLYFLIHDEPNPEMSSVRFRKAVQGNATLRNQGFALIVRNGMGEVAELRPIENRDIRPERDTLTKELRYRLEGEGLIGPDRILHIMGDTENGVCGIDPVGVAAECIGLAIALQDNAARFFGNGSRPGLIFELPGVLTPEAAARLKEDLQKKTGGNENAYRVVILEEGLKLAAQSGRIPNDAAQFDEQVARQDAAIARVFGIPQHIVGILDKSTNNNIEHQGLEFDSRVLMHWVAEWEQELNRKLLSPSERRVYSFGFVMEGLVRGALKDRYEAYAVGRNWGWLSVNDIRSRENMNTIEGGDVYLQPLNMQPAGEPPEQQPQPQTQPQRENQSAA